MGKQIRFFATASDFQCLLDIIYDRGSYVIDCSGNKVSLEDIKSKISEAYATDQWLPHCFIVKNGWKIVLDSGCVNQLESEAIELSVCRRIPEKKLDLSPVHKQFQENGYTVISDTDKYFEILREYEQNPIYMPNPMYIENGYEHGRLWYPTRFYAKNGKTILQSKAVKKEYDALSKAIKKMSVKSKDKYAFFMLPDALKCFKNNTFIPRSGNYTIYFDKGERQ